MVSLKHTVYTEYVWIQNFVETGSMSTFELCKQKMLHKILCFCFKRWAFYMNGPHRHLRMII